MTKEDFWCDVCNTDDHATSLHSDAEAICPDCEGNGTRWGDTLGGPETHPCPDCDGTGWRHSPEVAA